MQRVDDLLVVAAGFELHFGLDLLLLVPVPEFVRPPVLVLVLDFNRILLVFVVLMGYKNEIASWKEESFLRRVFRFEAFVGVCDDQSFRRITFPPKFFVSSSGRNLFIK